MKCEICGRPMDKVKALHRINETGVKGRWACEEHIHLFPNKKPDDEVQEIVDILTRDPRLSEA